MRLFNLTLIAALATGCVIHVDPDYETGPAQIENRYRYVDGPITEIIAEVDAGSLFITGTNSLDATVDADLFYDWDSEPYFDVYTLGNTLYVVLDCPVALGDCSGDITVEAPFDAFLDTTLGAGDLTVHNTLGDWIGSVGAGDISGTNLAGFWVDVLADTGVIDLSFDLEPDVVAAYVRVGDVHLTVPTGAYDVTTTVHTGSVWMNGVVDDPYASRELTATASTGNIQILGF